MGAIPASCPQPSRGNRMKIHKNARLTPLRREEMARGVLAGEMNRREAAASFGVTANTVSKWVEHFRDFGPAGMPDRSSRPRRMRRPTPAHVVERIVHLRRHRLTGAHIAAATGVSAATVSRVLKRAGLSRIKDLEPEEPARRCEHDNPGDLTPPRRQEVRPLRPARPPRHRHPGRPPPGVRLGMRPHTSASTTPRASPAAACSPTRGRRAPSSAWRPPRTATSASGSPCER